MNETKNNNDKRKNQPRKKIAYKEKNGELKKAIDEKIAKDTEFDSMAELFDLLDVYLPDGGKSRKAAVDHLKRYLFIEQKDKSHKIVIKEKYKKPIKIEDGRKNNAAVYKPLIKAILLNCLLREENHIVRWSYSNIVEELGIRNHFYRNKEIRKKLPSFQPTLSKQMIDDFFKWTSSKNKNLIDYTLESLQKEEWINYHKYLAIQDKWEAREATPEEFCKIKSAEKRIILQMGYQNSSEVFLAGKLKVLHTKVEKETGLTYFTIFEIFISDPDILKDGITSNILECKKQLNNLIIASDIKSATHRVEGEDDRIERKFERDKEKMALGEPRRRSRYHLYDEDYVECYQTLEEYFTRLSPAEEIFMELQEIERMIEEEKTSNA